MKNVVFNKKTEYKNLKVCAYVRVSTNKFNQENSFKSQIYYYENKIKENPNWDFVKVYADYGISGTKVLNRSEFVQLIIDCFSNKIDYILTKSISRFSRNSKDFLTIIKKLRELNIGVYFEEENINSLYNDSDFLLTVLSSIAMQESINIGEHIKKARSFNKNILNSSNKKSKENKNTIKKEQIFVKSAFNKKMKCGCCFSNLYKRKIDKKIIWTCKRSLCLSDYKIRPISQNNLELIFMELLKCIYYKMNEEYNEKMIKLAKNYKKLTCEKNILTKNTSLILTKYLEKEIPYGDYLKIESKNIDLISALSKKAEINLKELNYLKKLNKILLNFKNKIKKEDIKVFNEELFESTIKYVILGGFSNKGKWEPFLVRFILKENNAYTFLETFSESNRLVIFSNPINYEKLLYRDLDLKIKTLINGKRKYKNPIATLEMER